MILCVSNIIWSEGGRRADGIDRVPELELTDGWYRLRASVDPPMARAIGRGVIRIGRKLGVAAARVRIGFLLLFPSFISVDSSCHPRERSHLRYSKLMTTPNSCYQEILLN